MNNLKHVTFLTLLGLTLSLSNQVWGSDHNGDDLYQKAQEIRHSNNMTTDSLPLSYFEALDHAASAGSTKAKKELQSYSDNVNYSTPMSDRIIWGGTPQANEQIRNIFKKWGSQKGVGDDLYQKAQEIKYSINMTTDSLPLSYFEALNHAASAGSTKAEEELQSYSHYVTHPSPMTDGLIWGGTPQANEQIRNIFKKWAPKKIN